MRNVFLQRSFEPDFLKLASAVLSEGGVAFYCGPNFGLCTFGLLRSVELDHLSFHLFETNRNLIPYLEKSKSLFPAAAIQVVEGCVSDRSGTSRLQIDSQSTGHSHVDSDGTIAQENIVLDDYLERHGFEFVTFLKMRKYSQ